MIVLLLLSYCLEVLDHVLVYNIALNSSIVSDDFLRRRYFQIYNKGRNLKFFLLLVMICDFGFFLTNLEGILISKDRIDDVSAYG
jgi:hypothetical protein